MKNLFSSIAVLFLLFSIGCKKDVASNSTEPSLEAQFKELCNTPQTEEVSLTDMSGSYITKIDQKKLNLLLAMNAQSEKNTGPVTPGNPPVITSGWQGPYFVTGALSKISSNTKVFIDHAKVPSLASGIYFCDVYLDQTTVNLASGEVARLEIGSMPKYGYSKYSDQTSGVNAVQSQNATSNTFYMSTYSLIVQYTASGQYVGRTIPTSLTGMQFAYSVFR